MFHHSGMTRHRSLPVDPSRLRLRRDGAFDRRGEPIGLLAAVLLAVVLPWGVGSTVTGDSVPPAPMGLVDSHHASEKAPRAGAEHPVGVGVKVELTLLGRTATRPHGQPDDDRTAVLAGQMLHSLVRVELQDATVAEALAAFARVVQVPLLPLYVRRAGDPGLDPLERISVSLTNVPAYEALQAMAHAALGDSGTWQIHEGRIEFGPKWVLARSAARQTVTVPIKDLLLEPPGMSLLGSAREELRRRFPDAVFEEMRATRSTPTFVAAQLVIEIERRIEPEAWVPDESLEAVLVRSGEHQNPLTRAGQWASMTMRDGTLVLTAPDFVLRGIRGYPRILPPAVEAEAPSRRAIVPPVERVVAEQGGGRMELLGFLPSRGRGAPRHEAGARLNAAALAAAGRLAHARLHAQLQDTPVRDAVEMLSKTTGASILPIWAHGSRLGIDPDDRITLELEDAGGLEVLDMLLTLANATSPCDWQLHGGGIEIGPKLQLARPEARRTVIVEVSDLLIEAPYFIAPDWGSAGMSRDGLRDIITPLERDFGRELGMSRRIPPPGSSVPGEIRKSQKFIAAELLLLLEKHIEPRGWIPTDEQKRRAMARGDRPFEPLQREGAWIVARYVDGKLTLSAPDFVLRRIVGYPHLPSPAGR